MKKTFFKKQLSNIRKITTFDITISAFLMILIIISKMTFFNINILTMRVGISYTFLILAGLILNFFLGLIVVILGDILALLINGTIGFWHYAYFFIPILIFIITYSLKFLFKIKKSKLLILINFCIFILIASIIFVFFIIKNDFIIVSNNLKINKLSKILIWVMFGLMNMYSIIISILYFKSKSDKFKDHLIINIIVSLVFVLMIWFYGPFAQILWLSDTYNNKNYWSSYDFFQISRILKTPIMLPIYNFIVISVYKIYKQIKNSHIKKW